MEMVRNELIPLEKRLANYGPWVKSGPPPVSVNKVSLEHSQAHLFILFGCFPSTTAEQSNCLRDHMAHRVKKTENTPYLGPFRRGLLTLS